MLETLGGSGGRNSETVGHVPSHGPRRNRSQGQDPGIWTPPII